MNARRFGFVACALLLSGTLFACSGGSVPSSTPTPSPKPTATPSTSPPLPSSSIFVANPDYNSITVYAPNPSGTLNEAPLATITGGNTGLSSPVGVAVDATGRIYVANNSGGYGNQGSVTVYAPNPHGIVNESPLATIGGSGARFHNPYGIAVDASGKIYVVNGLLGNVGAGPVAVYAANPMGSLSEGPLATISGSNTGLSSPFGIALDANGNIYVTNAGYGTEVTSITVYAANPSGALNELPLGTISGGNTHLGSSFGVAIDASGKIYAASNYASSDGVLPGAITVYAANPSGLVNQDPLATITGNNTALSDPVAIAIDKSGRIYVGSGRGLTVYAASPTGTVNETPLATISGSDTGISPTGIAIH